MAALFQSLSPPLITHGPKRWSSEPVLGMTLHRKSLQPAGTPPLLPAQGTDKPWIRVGLTPLRPSQPCGPRLGHPLRHHPIPTPSYILGSAGYRELLRHTPLHLTPLPIPLTTTTILHSFTKRTHTHVNNVDIVLNTAAYSVIHLAC